MKKIILFAAISILAASQGYAGTTIDCSVETAGSQGKALYGDKTAASATTTLIGKTSTGVALGGITGVSGYALNTQHKSGTRVFGSSWDSTSVFYEDATVGVTKIVKPGTSDATAFNGWQTM